MSWSWSGVTEEFVEPPVLPWRHWLLTLSALLAVAGCAVAPEAPLGLDVAATTPSAATVPTAVELPTIGVHSGPLISVGLGADGVIQTPPVSKPQELAYYAYGPVPGAPGPALLIGHVNGNGRAGVFAKLKQVRVGDAVLVDTPGHQDRFVVYRTELIPKCDPAVTPGSTCMFPWTAILADTPGPELRLVTCDGRLNATVHSYTDNRVVYARLA